MAYDYVLAGGGSAGATLAARLSEDHKTTVCLIEAGGEGRSVVVRAPIGVAAMLPGKPKINNWAFETVPQPGLNGRRGYQPRGKALGGSSAINGMIYIRGHHTDYDDWAALGCEGWSWQEVLPYFKRAEGNERGADDFHGGDGPLRVANQRSPRPIASAFVEACAENQIRRNNDFNGPEQEGAGLYQVTQFWGGDRNGERCSTAAAYLHPVMNRPNLIVITNAQVTGIVFDGKRATGLRYRRDRREEITAVKACGKWSWRLRNLPGPGAGGAANDKLEQAVIRTYIPAALSLDDKRRSLRPDPRINHREQHGAGRKPDPIRSEQIGCRFGPTRRRVGKEFDNWNPRCRPIQDRLDLASVRSLKTKIGE